jgi:hypothetical protein
MCFSDTAGAPSQSKNKSGSTQTQEYPQLCDLAASTQILLKIIREFQVLGSSSDSASSRRITSLLKTFLRIGRKADWPYAVIFAGFASRSEFIRQKGEHINRREKDFACASA